MYENGSPVTLKVRKTHKLNDNEQLEISSGILGLISHGSRSSDGNHNYVVNFGAQGEWNCLHNELDGDDQEQGWDSEGERIEPEQQHVNINIPHPGSAIFEPGVLLPPDSIMSFSYDPAEPEKHEETENPKIDIEADIARRIKELERK
jgi:hypothetical protein